MFILVTGLIQPIDVQIKVWKRGADQVPVQVGEFVCQSACVALAISDDGVFAGDTLGNAYFLHDAHFEA